MAICTTWGNQAIEDTTDNTLRLADAMQGLDVPVYRGCDTAMVKYLTNDYVENRPHVPVMQDGKPVAARKHLDLCGGDDAAPEPPRGLLLCRLSAAHR